MVSDSISTTKVAVNDTTPEALFKALEMVQKELPKATVKGGNPKARHTVIHVSDIANYHVPTSDDIYKTTKTGIASFKGPSGMERLSTLPDHRRVGSPGSSQAPPETSLFRQRHHSSSTAIGYGPRSESGRYWADRADCEDRSGHSRFGSAAPAAVIGHCEL